MISIAIVILMCYGNLRGIREAGRAFALPTYLFSGSVDPDDHHRAWSGRSFGDLPQLHWPAARAVHRALDRPAA